MVKGETGCAVTSQSMRSAPQRKDSTGEIPVGQQYKRAAGSDVYHRAGPQNSGGDNYVDSKESSESWLIPTSYAGSHRP